MIVPFAYLYYRLFTCITVCLPVLPFVYLYYRWRFNYQEERDGVPLTGLNLPQHYACSKPGPGFLTSYVLVFYMLNDLR